MQEAGFPFDYEIPRELVAQEPLRHRADARLMVVDRQTARRSSTTMCAICPTCCRRAIGWC